MGGACAELGTHGLTPTLFLKLLQAEVGAPCFLLAIEPERVGPELPPSPAVLSAIEEVANLFHRLTSQARDPYGEKSP